MTRRIVRRGDGWIGGADRRKEMVDDFGATVDLLERPHPQAIITTYVFAGYARLKAIVSALRKKGSVSMAKICSRGTITPEKSKPR